MIKRRNCTFFGKYRTVSFFTVPYPFQRRYWVWTKFSDLSNPLTLILTVYAMVFFWAFFQGRQCTHFPHTVKQLFTVFHFFFCRFFPIFFQKTAFLAKIAQNLPFFADFLPFFFHLRTYAVFFERLDV